VSGVEVYVPVSFDEATLSAPRKKREKIRRKHSAPVVERFLSWCDEQWPGLPEDTPLHDGVRYARNQREGLQRFLDNGDLPLTNNVSERELRRQAVGRKNWIFVGSDDGARTNAVFTSRELPHARCRAVGIPARRALLAASLADERLHPLLLKTPRGGAGQLRTPSCEEDRHSVVPVTRMAVPKSARVEGLI